jgi:SNF2 family DNA or RNA helicase
LLSLAEAIDERSFTKYRRFLSLLKDELKWKPSRKDDRIVVFSERIATIEWLAARLRTDLGLTEGQARTLHASGQGADVRVRETVADFGIEKKPIRILMASEGLNLHYLSHKLIHFDIPWALIKFQQRNGRIDRYGQEREPHVWYLIGHPKQKKIGGDLRILERLIERDNTASENIGDPSVFLGTNDEEEQEDVVAEAFETGKIAETMPKWTLAHKPPRPPTRINSPRWKPSSGRPSPNRWPPQHPRLAKPKKADRPHSRRASSSSPPHFSGCKSGYRICGSKSTGRTAF